MKDVAVSSIMNFKIEDASQDVYVWGINFLLEREREDSDVATSVICMWCCFIFKLVFDSICNSETDDGLLQSLMWNVELAAADIK